MPSKQASRIAVVVEALCNVLFLLSVWYVHQCRSSQHDERECMLLHILGKEVVRLEDWIPV